MSPSVYNLPDLGSPDLCVCAGARPPEGGMTESQSWVTAKAQEMFQKTGNWSPDRPYPDDLHDNRHNPQV